MKICHLPIYKKAKEIEGLTETLVSSFDNNKKGRNKEISKKLISHSKKLSQKIAAAEGGDIYSLRISNALQIRSFAKELQTMLNLSAALKLAHRDYITFIINEVDRFRELFLDWVSTFDKTNDIHDDWYFEV
jgi:hypothetical protein